jgi:hydrogenase expression/formation protein HypC
MCLAIPMKLVAVEGFNGTVLEGSIQREVRLDLVEAPEVGQYVLIHAGYAIQVLDEKEAIETLELVEQAYPHLFADNPPSSEKSHA